MTRVARLRVTTASPEPAARDLAEQGEASLTIGRGAEAGWRFDEPDLSRVHARIGWAGGRLELEDLGSRNGTALNGARLAARTTAALKTGDRLRVGPVAIHVALVEETDGTLCSPIAVDATMLST
ncbi:MAG: FHA domain-containing protein, partial [Myxococcota bacterium]